MSGVGCGPPDGPPGPARAGLADPLRRGLLAGGSLAAAGWLLPGLPVRAAPVMAPTRLALLEQNLSSHSLSDRIVTLPGSGRRFRLFTAVPRRPAPAKGWPVLYCLDGNAVFDRLTAADLAAVPGLVVLGVGYDTDLPFETRARALDYTPPLSPDGPVPDPMRPGRMAGAADRFLPLLTGPLRAQAEAGLAIDPARRSLWGHSYGGLFVLFAWLTAPQGFARYVAASPSLWWGDGVMTRLEAAHPPPRDRPLLLSFGDSERRSDDPRPPDGAPRPTLAFGQRMQARGAPVSLHQIADAGHGAALTRSIPLALDWATRRGDEAAKLNLD